MTDGPRDAGRSPSAWEVLAALREAVVVIDGEDRVAFVNLEAERLLGATAADLAGTPADALHPQRLRPAHPGGLLRQIASRSHTLRGEGERQIVTRSDGLEIEVEVLATLLPSGCSGFVVATLRRLLHAQPSTSEPATVSPNEREAYRLVFDHGPLGIAHFDERGIVTTCNDYLCVVFGASKRDLIGVNLSSLRDPRLLAAIRSALSGQLGEFEGDYQVMTSGKSTAMHALFAPVRDATGAVRGGVVMIEDVSERRRAEDAAQLSEEQFRILINSAPDGIAVHRDGRLVFVNPAFVRMLGHASPEALLERPLADLLEPEQHAELERRTRRMLDTGMPLPTWEQRMRCKDGAELTVEVASLPLRFDGKRAILDHLRDVTERKLMEARLAQADRLASVGTLAAGVAHEINNPLAYALGSLEVAARQLGLLRATLADAPELAPVLAILGECLDNAAEGNERVRVIVRDLMTFSRARAESRALLDVEAVLDSALNLAWNEIRHRARLVKSYSGAPPVLADESRLGQVFLNLLLNAAQAIPEGNVSENEIRLSTQKRGQDVLVIVEDTGSGIAGEHLGHIFEPFFTTKPTAGTGLGLSICHGIVSALGGEICVESVPGRGSRFNVVLPAAGADSHASRLPTPPPARRVARARVLVIDDEPMLAETLRLALAEHEVISVENGAQALELLQTDRRFDLVLCDLMMPELSGARVYDCVQSFSRELAERFVFMTGGAFTPGARSFLESFEGHWLEKPFGVDRILSLLIERQL